MSHHVGVELPDGRMALADHELPVVKPMQRILLALAESAPPAESDWRLVAAWLDDHPEQNCTFASIRKGCHR